MQKNDILMIHGTDYKEMTKRLLAEADVAGMIKDPAAKIALKPNLVTSNPPSSGATTHAELLAGAIALDMEKRLADLSAPLGELVEQREYAELSEAFPVIPQVQILFVKIRNAASHDPDYDR